MVRAGLRLTLAVEAAPPYSTMDGWRGRLLIRLGIAVGNHADSGRRMSSNPICASSPIASSRHSDSEISKTESRLADKHQPPGAIPERLFLPHQLQLRGEVRAAR